MSASELDVFDKTLPLADVWLREIQAEIGSDRRIAWRALSTVLHKLRDRLPAELAEHFGAGLPLLVRGAYYDRYRPSRPPAAGDTAEEFVNQVAEGLSDIQSANSEAAVRAVLGTLSRHVTPSRLAEVRHALPEKVRTVWPEAKAPIGYGFH